MSFGDYDASHHVRHRMLMVRPTSLLATMDIFRFWVTVERRDRIHPADREVFARVKGHTFDLKCLPGCFGGPLRTAPIVLLYLSPGWSPLDRKDAVSKSGQNYHMRRRRGYEPFRQEGPGFKWVRSRTKCFGLRWEQIASKIALLNIGSYHSKSFTDIPLLAALPSSRMSIAWAQEVLFPEAIAGKRVVICLRAARFWGLEPGKQYGKSLFAPKVTRAGHMKHGTMRNRITRAVRRKLNEHKS
jgi:hypothetical protein